MTRPVLAMVPLILACTPAAAQTSPRHAVDELIAAERLFSERADKDASFFETLLETMSEDAAMPLGREGWLNGRAAIRQRLGREQNWSGHGRVMTVRAGISADGQHGFTFGYAELLGAPEERQARRYLAYWVKRPEGWRIAAYRQAFVRTPETLRRRMEPSLPAGMTPQNQAATEGHRATLVAAERAFSDRAQQVGLRAAFQEFGRADSMNLSMPGGITIGNDLIASNMPGGPGSQLEWSADRALVASSGDLGVTFGMIRSKDPAAQGQPGAPFFTIWRRDGPGQPWRYIAE